MVQEEREGWDRGGGGLGDAVSNGGEQKVTAHNLGNCVVMYILGGDAWVWLRSNTCFQMWAFSVVYMASKNSDC